MNGIQPELIKAYEEYINYIKEYKERDRIDLSGIKFFYPTTLLPLLIFIGDNNCDYKEPNDPNVNQYFKRMKGDYEESPIKRSYIPPIPLPNKEEFNTIVQKFYEWLSEYLPTSYTNGVEYIISELGDNVYVHSM